MKLFESARIHLTLWYLLLIALISLSFSLIIYRYVSWELERGFRVAEYRLRGLPMPGPHVRILLEDELQTAKQTVLFRLFTLNGFILVSAGVAGYFLAGKNLQPIKKMVDEQKRFVADASHELRTPLTSMKSEIEVALRDKRINLRQAKDLLKSNLEEVDKMKYFSDDLLSLSRYDANGRNLPIEEVDLSEAARQAIERSLPQAKKKKINVETKLKEVIVRGNPQSLVELISILVDNAIKYSPLKGEITVGVSSVKKNALIEVSDMGIGISKKDIPHIFDRFYRADTARSKRQVEGYGLGLAIAKSIVDLHKGEIKVNSTPGKGSTFRVILPTS